MFVASCRVPRILGGRAGTLICCAGALSREVCAAIRLSKDVYSLFGLRSSGGCASLAAFINKAVSGGRCRLWHNSREYVSRRLGNQCISTCLVPKRIVLCAACFSIHSLTQLCLDGFLLFSYGAGNGNCPGRFPQSPPPGSPKGQSTDKQS